MNSLDPPYDAIDRNGMAARIEALADHVDDALAHWSRASWQPPIARPDLLAIGALGGSAIAGDLTDGLYADRLRRPLLVVRDYRWPACVSHDSLALLCSYSGNTEETLSLYREAERRAIPRLAMTTGGALGVLCLRDGVQFAALPGGSPPRAALFPSWVALTHLVHALGWVEDPAPEWRAAAASLRAARARIGIDVPEAENPAKQMARRLAGRLVLVYSGRERVQAVGTRIRQQLNENAKVLAHSAAVPELNHNEIVGWEKPGAIHAASAVLILRDVEDTPETEARLALTAEYVQRQGAVVETWRSSGETRLARLATLVQFGDYVSLYLALVQGTDPTPIPSIDEFKRRLAAPGTARGL